MFDRPSKARKFRKEKQVKEKQVKIVASKSKELPSSRVLYDNCVFSARIRSTFATWLFRSHVPGADLTHRHLKCATYRSNLCD